MDLHQKYLLAVACLGTIFLIVGISVVIVTPSYVHNAVLDAVLLENGSDTAKLWENPPYDMSLQFWFFNLTNADEVALAYAKPMLSEVGPYGFDEHQKKMAVEYHDNGTISYKNFKWFTFNSTKSCSSCNPNDLITVPNVPFWTLLHKLRQSGTPVGVKKFISFGLIGLGEGAFITRSVDALLFTGYLDILFSMAKAMHWLAPDFDFPDRMGFMYGKNYSYDGPYLINSGVMNLTQKGTMELFQGSTFVNYWNSEWANMINGSDGSVYPPFMDRSQILKLFSPDLCRSLYVRYDSDGMVDKLATLQFAIPEDALDDTTSENAGFCWPTDIYYPKIQIPDSKSGLACLPPGLLNISKCQKDAPIVLSFPHFLFTPEEVQQSVYGMHPDPAQHKTILEFEPITGIGISFRRKLQINVAAVRDNDFTSLKKFKSAIIPVFWLNESAYLNAETREALWHRLFLPQKLAYGSAYALISLGTLIIVLTVSLFAVNTYMRRELRMESDSV
ncbi:Lysosome membrane protein 2 [Trichinella spiralis]|uniref:Lysosome membrane protein 2 n=1 Tax=Trichinella spiralis TaxID=6334 RepID=A0A0V1BNU2_TRISP|nr:Lysosome membrane protein 2 [Trichinella spiralis]